MMTDCSPGTETFADMLKSSTTKVQDFEKKKLNFFFILLYFIRFIFIANTRTKTELKLNKLNKFPYVELFYKHSS